MSQSHRPLDVRSGLVLDTHDLIRQAGAMREVTDTVQAPTSVGNGVIEVPQGSRITLDLRLEAVVEGVLVTGTASATATGECGRCLTPISMPVEVDVQELYAYADRDLSADEAEELSTMTGDLLDLEPVLRDQVVLDLPFQPLCREDCLGLCPRCGFRLNDDSDHRHDDEVDPRWAGLSGWQPDASRR